MTLFSTILTVVAIVATIVKPTNADASPTRGMRAESFLESVANNTTSIIKDELLSRIKADYHDDVLSFTQSSSSPTHDNMHGSCVHANDDTELGMYINSSPDGQVRLCPGIVNFSDEIVLTTSITLSCAGPTGTCILDGHGETRHFFSDTGGLTLTFISLVLINGLAGNGSSLAPFGGSVLFVLSTSIFNDCFFYNNRVISSFAVSTIIISLC